MKIVDIDVIAFRVPRTPFRNGTLLPEQSVVQTLTKIVTDEGIEGYYLGGHGHGDQDGLPPDQRAALRGRMRSMLVGQDPFDREKFWHWMWVSKTATRSLNPPSLSLVTVAARRSRPAWSASCCASVSVLAGARCWTARRSTSRRDVCCSTTVVFWLPTAIYTRRR